MREGEGGARGRCVANGFTNVVSPKVNDCGAESEKEGEGGGQNERGRETISHQRKDFSREIIPGPKEKSPNEGKKPDQREETKKVSREGGRKKAGSKFSTFRSRGGARLRVRSSINHAIYTICYYLNGRKRHDV